MKGNVDITRFFRMFAFFMMSVYFFMIRFEAVVMRADIPGGEQAEWEWFSFNYIAVFMLLLAVAEGIGVYLEMKRGD